MMDEAEELRLFKRHLAGFEPLPGKMDPAWEEGPPALVELNRHFAMTLLSKDPIFYLAKVSDRVRLQRFSMSRFKLHFDPHLVSFRGKSMGAGTAWLSMPQRRLYSIHCLPDPNGLYGHGVPMWPGYSPRSEVVWPCNVFAV
jgi:hypothetical protein